MSNLQWAGVFKLRNVYPSLVVQESKTPVLPEITRAEANIREGSIHRQYSQLGQPDPRRGKSLNGLSHRGENTVMAFLD